MLKSFIFSFLSVLLITSCTEETEKSKDIEPKEETPYFDDGGSYQDAEFAPPSTSGTLAQMMRVEWDFNPDVLPNFVLNIEGMTEQQLHLNFGARRADLEYLIATNHTDDIPKCLESYNELAKGLRLDKGIDYPSLSKRMNANLHNQDSILILYTLLGDGMADYMYDNELSHLEIIHFAGDWIEMAHFLLVDWETNLEQSNWRIAMTEHFSVIGHFTKALQGPEFNEDEFSRLIEDLENIKTFFTSLQSVTDFYEDENAEEVIFTAEEMAQLSDMIENLRSKTIAG